MKKIDGQRRHEGFRVLSQGTPNSNARQDGSASHSAAQPVAVWSGMMEAEPARVGVPAGAGMLCPPMQPGDVLVYPGGGAPSQNPVGGVYLPIKQNPR